MDEAIDLLRQYDMYASMGQMVHFAIGGNTGRGVVVEYINNEMVVTETPVVTNFYLAAGLTGETIQTAPLPAFPTLDKAGLLEHFDQLITVPDLTQEELRRFDAEEKADRKPYMGTSSMMRVPGTGC